MQAYDIFKNPKTSLAWKKKFAYKAAALCLEKYKKPIAAALFYERLLLEQLNAPEILSFKEKKEVESSLAEIYFYDLKSYRKAIRYYKESLEFTPYPKKKYQYQYQIAKSFFLLHKYEQSLRELQGISKKLLSLEDRASIDILKSSIYIAQKNFKKAIPFLKQQIKKYPHKKSLFRESLALIYEEKKQFRLAIRELEKISPPTPFVRQKINWLYDRFRNQPGVRF
ncbi:MAG: tetratricopeptide repeat protein [Bdellovibrionales bacterium]